MIAAMRAKTPMARLRIADGMFRSARAMLVHTIGTQHPEWTREQVEREASRRILGGAL